MRERITRQQSEDAADGQSDRYRVAGGRNGEAQRCKNSAADHAANTKRDNFGKTKFITRSLRVPFLACIGRPI